MLPLNTWVFLSLGIDVSANKQYGFRYKLGALFSSPTTIVFKHRTPTSGNYYALTSAGVIQWTNDNYAKHCNCKMQYVRLYTDFVPYNEDMMINLALMNPDSNN